MISYFFLIIIFNFLIFYFYETISRFFNIFDYPDHKRKIHTYPVPLLGGLFLLINLALILYINHYFIQLFDTFFFKNTKNLYSFFLIIFFFFW
jgi:UDP-N-acetylmuramyl pentapeptide phosphotransferase/UDP-N-acetylglucosamine-1-phosphate transferase